MVLNVHRNHKAYQGRGEWGRVYGGGGKGRLLYLWLHCHHQNDSCVKKGTKRKTNKITILLSWSFFSFLTVVGVVVVVVVVVAAAVAAAPVGVVLRICEWILCARINFI